MLGGVGLYFLHCFLHRTGVFSHPQLPHSKAREQYYFFINNQLKFYLIFSTRGFCCSLKMNAQK